MLQWLMHSWERRLVAVTKDRVVRPFEWGLDWIPANGHRSDARPQDVLADWVSHVMSDTDAFFATPPSTDYRFTPAEHAVDGGLLTFPSAFETPHKENNTVYCRLSGPRRADAPAARRRAVVVLPQWNADAGGHVGLCRLLAWSGLSALRLTLPYHERRMPPPLHRADYIVSSNVARTVQVCRQAVMDARRAVAWLASEGYDRIGILGTSLGSCLALLTTAHEPLIRAQALNHISPYFADVVWRGLSTRHVRESLENNVTLGELRELWRPINPWSYLDRVAATKTLLVYARYDLTFPVDLSRILVDEFARRRLPHEVSVLPCGHYSTGVAPFSYMDAYVLISFLRRNL